MTRDADKRRQLLEEFGQRVRVLRDESGLTQDQLAKASGVHRVTIARVEAGRREVGLTSLVALARALGHTASDLLEGCDETRFSVVDGRPKSPDRDLAF